jgi:hypothetical protein
MDKKSFYKVLNSDTKTYYMIIEDEENTYIYNVNRKKVMRTIQHKDGGIKTNVYPAKEGHIMVSEYHRKDKYTRFFIEALTDRSFASQAFHRVCQGSFNGTKADGGACGGKVGKVDTGKE